MKMNEMKLKPCPFCGSEANIKIISVSEGVVLGSIGCSNSECSARIRFTGMVKNMYLTIEEISEIADKELEKWNKRSAATFNREKMIEELEEYLFEKYCIEGDTKIDEIVEKGGIE